MSGLLELREITRTFTVPDSEPLQILTGVNLSVSPGEHVAIVGRSGTGKSTLLNILGLIDKPTLLISSKTNDTPFLPPNCSATSSPFVRARRMPIARIMYRM